MDQGQTLLQLIGELARELPPATLVALVSALESGESSRGLDRFAATQVMKERLRKIDEVRASWPAISDSALALALQAAARTYATVASEQYVEIAWTGPATEAVPVRRVDQVVYDLLESARDEILLVTFAAYRAERALLALGEAAGRGVHLKLVIELAEESGGKISFDGLKALRAAVPSAQIYWWPLKRRTQSATGSCGTMHAKCLVADRSRAIVSSANLTGHALEANMELGFLVEGTVAARLAAHFDQLIVRGELVEVP